MLPILPTFSCTPIRIPNLLIFLSTFSLSIYTVQYCDQNLQKFSFCWQFFLIFSYSPPAPLVSYLRSIFPQVSLFPHHSTEPSVRFHDLQLNKRRVVRCEGHCRSKTHSPVALSRLHNEMQPYRTVPVLPLQADRPSTVRYGTVRYIIVYIAIFIVPYRTVLVRYFSSV